jgi:DNA-binding GntR family transcriptional regulator
VTDTLADKAYALIKNDILTCVLEPGEQIGQQQLAERHQLGTTPVREALQRLTQEGYVQSLPRFGYTVSHVTIADVHEIYELRLILEPGAARLAATRATDEQLDAIAQAAESMYAVKDERRVLNLNSHNVGFHRSIAAATGNRRLLDSINSVIDEMTRIFYLGTGMTYNVEEMRDGHLVLIQALRDRDADAAEEIMRRHLVRSTQDIVAALASRLGSFGQGIPIRLPHSS